jgi:hypothetical protein
LAAYRLCARQPKVQGEENRPSAECGDKRRQFYFGD